MGPPAECQLVVVSGLAPPLLQATQVAHIAVGFDVVWLDGQRRRIAMLSLLRAICISCVRA